MIRRAAAAVILTLAAVSPAAAERGPLFGAEQLVLVIAETDSSARAALAAFDRTAAGWEERASWPVVIGRSGLAWGLGIHRAADRVPGEPVKHEGDGKSPAGAFVIGRAFGYPPRDSVRTGLPYIQSTPDIIWIDDPASPAYNRVLDLRNAGLGRPALPSHERMLRDDLLYRYVVVIEHNTTAPIPGAGSCIFLHVWRGPDAPTAGCTAMGEADMRALLGWLDAAKRPVIVQLTRAGYDHLKKPWGLPGR